MPEPRALGHLVGRCVDGEVVARRVLARPRAVLPVVGDVQRLESPYLCGVVVGDKNSTLYIENFEIEDTTLGDENISICSYAIGERCFLTNLNT